MNDISASQWEAFQARLRAKRAAEDEEERRLRVCPATGGSHQAVRSREGDVFCFQCRRTLEEVA